MTASIPDQPPPVYRDGPSAHELVVDDIRERGVIGVNRYGVKLRPGNGRDSFIDAYQEALDLVAYMRNVIEQIRAHDGEAHRAVLLPDGHIAVRVPGVSPPWFSWVASAGHLTIRRFRDDQIPPGCVPLTPMIET
jgi:hypothetical protein